MYCYLLWSDRSFCFKNGQCLLFRVALFHKVLGRNPEEFTIPATLLLQPSTVHCAISLSCVNNYTGLYSYLTGSKALGSGGGRFWNRLMISRMLLLGSGLEGDSGGDSSSDVEDSGGLLGSGGGFTSVDNTRGFA